MIGKERSNWLQLAMPSSIRSGLGVTEKFRGKPKFSEVEGNQWSNNRFWMSAVWQQLCCVTYFVWLQHNLWVVIMPTLIIGSAYFLGPPASLCRSCITDTVELKVEPLCVLKSHAFSYDQAPLLNINYSTLVHKIDLHASQLSERELLTLLSTEGLDWDTQ